MGAVCEYEGVKLVRADLLSSWLGRVTLNRMANSLVFNC